MSVRPTCPHPFTRYLGNNIQTQSWGYLSNEIRQNISLLELLPQLVCEPNYRSAGLRDPYPLHPRHGLFKTACVRARIEPA